MRTVGNPRRLNLKLAIILPIAIALLVGGVYLLHELQVKRTARKMLDRAEQAQKAGELSDAIRYYGYYVNYTPDDDEAFAQLALLVAEQADQAGANPRAQIEAYHRLERAVARRSNDIELVRRLADLSFKVGQWDVAAENYKRLIKEFPDESEFEVKLGLCQVATEKYLDAITSFEGVIARDTENITAYVELANLLRDQLDNPDRADAVMSQMVTSNSKRAKAYVERGLYFRRAEQDEEAEADIARALKLAPEDLDVLLAVAELAMTAKEFDRAETFLSRAQEFFPDDERLHRQLSQLRLYQNNPEEALKHLGKAVEQKTEDPAALIKLADLQLKSGDVEAVRATMKRMKKASYRPEILEFFEARILMVQGEWLKAVHALETLRSKVSGWPGFPMQIDLSLGACFERLRLPDRQLEAYQRVLDKDPTLVAAQVGYASALLHTGKVDEALREYRKIEKTLGSKEFLEVPALRNSLYQALMAQTARLPEAERDWTEVERLLASAEALEGVDDVQGTLMRAELLIKKGEIKQARSLVAAKRAQDPDQLILWTAEANLAALDGGTEQALTILDAAVEKFGDSLGLRLVRARLAARLDREAGKELLAKLAAETDEFSDQEKVALWQDLGGAYYRLRDREKAGQFWRKVAESRSADPRIRLAMFELAREMGDEPGMLEWVNAVKALLGSRSAEWNYCEASRLVWRVQQGREAKTSLGRATQLLKNAAELRPSWREIPRLEAEIALRQGQVDVAIERFLRADELGSLPSVHLAQLAQLLYTRGRNDEAMAVLAKLRPDQASPLKEKLEPELLLRSGQLEEALALAAQNVAGSQRATDYLWYGQLLTRAEKSQPAEEAFRRAIELNPNIPEAWLALVTVLVQSDKKSEAEQVVREAQVKLPEDRTSLVLAACYQILGDLANAEQYYLSAISAQPENLSVLRRVAEFYLRTNRADPARTYLSRIVKLTEQDPRKLKGELVWARRTLAQVLAASGDYRQQQQAIALLDRNTQGGKPALEDLRMKAVILASRPERSSKLKAIGVLEGIMQRESASGAQEKLLLARLYDSTNRWTDCRDQMVELLGQHPDEVQFIVTFIQMLLRRESPVSEITPWVEKLEELQPDAPGTTGIKARLAVKNGNPDEAVALLNSLVPRPLPLEQVGRLAEVARALEELRQYDDAKRLFTEFAEKAPGGSLVLAGFLGRHGTLDKALDQCEAALADVPVGVVLPTAVGILRDQRGNAKPEDFDRVEAWLVRALEENPNHKGVQLQLAGLRDLQGKYEELVKTYRDFVNRDDVSDREKALVWNNLAFVLAAGGGDGAEALELINNAIGILGPSPELLDTRGLAHLACGQTDAALSDLQQAITDNPSAVKYFHLALARQAANHRDAAVRAMQRARDNHQLTVDQVPAIERGRYQELLRSLDLP